ncbi:pyridoxamine 5'-phosphate oxidase [Maribellus comscasis]|uniref:Pyridoxine/pyridoxamine 5'-phosphate oxidase n=1 Tax=Maribellus comscasis TaxID=2681766 RepID=A0A6I6JWE4_9BACT|nr:pyridoxamine 5'-phosphate oxidase [Maribellus comscasis]QGY45450.1 pyridoxamine 5'-phosphate oxidase [Maribellus comscasis]
MKIDSVRREYTYADLSRETISENPVAQFSIWLDEVVGTNTDDSTAMSLVTFGTDGFPQSRIVLLKYFDENGFIFFTNYNSEKGISIESNPAVGLHFYWPKLERQVRISGFASKTETNLSDKYFHSRPLMSQISAIISEQSTEIPSRKYLENQFEILQNQLQNGKPARPENWGGYRVKPEKFEFWQGRENRLHDRISYEKQGDVWLIKRLAP